MSALVDLHDVSWCLLMSAPGADCFKGEVWAQAHVWAQARVAFSCHVLKAHVWARVA